MRKLCVIHFVELEKYPPTINLLRYLAIHSKGGLQIEVLTTGGSQKRIELPVDIKVHRLVSWRNKMGRLRRFLTYLQFNIGALLRLMKQSPDAILYYETLSAGAPWLFKLLFKKKTELFIHYHEYTSWPQYNSGMILERWLHKKEMYLYSKADWVSHTNRDRMELFLKDIIPNQPSFTHIVPNYPPASWRIQRIKPKGDRIGFVYVGALSLDTMFLREMTAFVAAHPKECYWDIYSANLSSEVISFIESQDKGNIIFRGAVAYDDLPGVLSDYDVGLVLYKGHIPNYVYNIPNKLFEYHVCGLDVWFPNVMKSSLPLVTEGTYPRIVSVDFQNLDSINLKQITDHSLLGYKQFDFYCEGILKPLADKLTKRNAV